MWKRAGGCVYLQEWYIRIMSWSVGKGKDSGGTPGNMEIESIEAEAHIEGK